MGLNFYHHQGEFELECGDVLSSLTIAYHTYGQRNEQGSNVVWVCHAFTASSDVADWWPGTVAEGGFLDPNRYFVVCANCLGSCYGTSTNGEPISILTMRDMAHAHSILADHLGIRKIHRLIGGSTGGAQALEWAYSDGARVDNLVLIASTPRITAWCQALSAAQRMAIQATGNKAEGLAVARAISMLIFRTSDAYDATQNDDDQTKLEGFKVESYLRYQGEKLKNRFTVESYLSLLQSIDNHNIGRGRGGVDAALSTIDIPTIVIAVDSDRLFTPAVNRAMAKAMPHAVYHEISSDFGHDGFLIELPQITSILK